MAKKEIKNATVTEEEKLPTSDFNLVNEEEEVVVTDDDFKLVDNLQYKRDQKFETKPTTFLKDSLKRFGKNKSSVVAAVILGIIILMAIFVPIFDGNDVSVSHPEIQYLEPKLFEAGTGFWDGCRGYTDITVDLATGYPAEYVPEAVRDLKVSDWIETNTVNTYGTGGYVRVVVNENELSTDYPSFFSQITSKDCYLDVTDSNKVTFTFSPESFEGFENATFNIYVSYRPIDAAATDLDSKVYLIKEATEEKEYTFDVSEAIANEGVLLANRIQLGVEIDNTDKSFAKNLFLKSVVAETDSLDEDFAEQFEGLSFTNANKMLLLDKDNIGYWNCVGAIRAAYKVRIKQCSFIYDTYLAKFGEKTMILGKSDMDQYIEKGWCTFDFTAKDPISTFKILSEKCPITTIEKVEISIFKGKTVVNIHCHVMNYKYLGYDAMPKFVMGTDKSGKDMFKYVFEGLRTSLIMGIITAAVCFTFGLVWGAISGYFGGNVDLAMERFTDILSGMPWIVVMTLCIVHLGQTFFVFVLALCLTGWIGTASTTRTQFYRFKGREYVLASRTLGASDMRIIFRHVLPNAMGTIITGAVLMVPSVIFSEATISYLGLGLKGLSSLGVILSDNQSELLHNPYLLIFPSVVIALLMICFNLFGNGLRDAINPSLKGEDE